jgi:hypothetical protein
MILADFKDLMNTEISIVSRAGGGDSDGFPVDSTEIVHLSGVYGFLWENTRKDINFSEQIVKESTHSLILDPQDTAGLVVEDSYLVKVGSIYYDIIGPDDIANQGEVILIGLKRNGS